MLAKKLMGSAGGSEKLYVDDCFSCFLYTGNGSTQTINNGIDLAGKGGLVWCKTRSLSSDHSLFDTNRGAGTVLVANTTAAQTGPTATKDLTSFNSNGFSLGPDWNSNANTNSATFVSWTFRKAPKFFDVVTYTGNGVAGRQIPHGLGVAPGMIIIKAVSGTYATSDWQVYHRSLGGPAQNYRLVLNTNAAQTGTFAVWNDTAPTDTGFSLGSHTLVNGTSTTYVAYLFAHDISTDGIIQCGSFTTDGSGNATVNLGWEPQFLLYKGTSSTFDWSMVDAMRGFSAWGGSPDAVLSANLSDAEDTGSGWLNSPIAVGFDAALSASSTYIYLAIRRPNKPPTMGTEVFQPTVYTGTNTDNRLVNTGIVTDAVWVRERNDTTPTGMVVGDRLRGNPYLWTGATSVENTDVDSLMTPTVGFGNCFSAMNGFGVGNDATSKVNTDVTANNHIALAFKRAPGFFDVVCYTGTGVAMAVNHNLGVAPELIIVKQRNGTGAWSVLPINATKYLSLSVTNAMVDTSAASWQNTQPTATQFFVGNSISTNPVGTVVAYLFASLPGISKVGSYTGNGTSQTINCGFATGARFFLVKATSTTGNWWVFDSARGIVSSFDPSLALNSTNAEVTSADAVDPDPTGIIVNQEATCSINATGVNYVFLAIA